MCWISILQQIVIFPCQSMDKFSTCSYSTHIFVLICNSLCNWSYSVSWSFLLDRLPAASLTNRMLNEVWIVGQYFDLVHRGHCCGIRRISSKQKISIGENKPLSVGLLYLWLAKKPEQLVLVLFRLRLQGKVKGSRGSLKVTARESYYQLYDH